ncbi:MAG TPA: isocitrate/isopropylmalate dehydrogenase family protein [Clostridia bacterium]|nr:isocitrate/isopropylmalate dehydrogenase family protein [Clostridia bacterium]
MRKYTIALIPGDGIGEEVIAAAKEVLEVVQANSGDFKLEFEVYPAGQETYQRLGKALPQETLDGIRNTDAALIGALNANPAPAPSPVGQMRKELDLYADVRPVMSWPGVWSLKPGIDLICIRENTEGFLADRNLHMGNGEFMPTEDVVMSVRVLTRQGSERIAKYAFELARKQNRNKITVIHKANVLRKGCGFFLEIVREIAKSYPDIELTDEYVDNTANQLILCPEKYDIILATNLFGDIISDEAAALVSNLVPSANIGKDCAVFSPVNHDGRMSEAGKDIANPLVHIICAAMMLEHLGEKEAGQTIYKAVKSVLADGVLKPRDLGGNSSTSQITSAICHRIAGNN